MINPVKIYKSIDSVQEVLTPFKPVFIEKPVFSKDVFEKQFEKIAPEKKGLLEKFANLEEYYKLVYQIWDLKTISTMPLNKIKILFSLASMRDKSLMLRFSPDELFFMSKLSEEKLKFLKPAARQKDTNGIFTYSFKQLNAISKFNQQETDKAIILLNSGLCADDLINICKDSSVNALQLKKRIETLKKVFVGNILDIRVKRFNDNYVIFLTENKEHKSFSYVFDKDFNLNKNYKSNIDFEHECFKKSGIFNKLNIFSKKKTPANPSLQQNLKVSPKEHIEALDTIQENIDNLKELQKQVYRKNCLAMCSNHGKIADTSFKLPENLIVKYYEKGALSDNDIINIFSENAGIIHQKDFDYFALRKIKLTPYDNEKCLDIRQKNAMSKPLKIDSDYYKKTSVDILNQELEKLEPIKAQKKLIIIDGLPGAGKSTIITKLLKNDSNAYFTPDSDEIKAAFKQIYQNGEGAALVHTASGNILKKEILPRVFEQGKNLIFQTSGSTERIHKILEHAKSHGYSVNLVHIETPENISIERAMNRYERTGRFIDPYDILAIFYKNGNEKKYTSRIFSYDSRLENSFCYRDKELCLVKEGRVEFPNKKCWGMLTD